MRAYGEVGVPKGTVKRTEVRQGDVGTRKPNEHYACYGWIHEADHVWRSLIATAVGKDQAKTIIDQWNRTKVGPGQTRSTYAKDIETVRHYKFGEMVSFRE